MTIAKSGVRLTIDAGDLRKLEEKLDGEKAIKPRLRKVLRQAGNLVRNEMRSRVPRRSGGRPKGAKPLYRSIQNKTFGTDKVTVKPTARHASMVQRGTKPHVISARYKGALAFGDNVRRRVEHPGAKAQPFVEETRAASEGPVAALIRDAIAELEREFNAP